jgi:hypothetical protein
MSSWRRPGAVRPIDQSANDALDKRGQDAEGDYQQGEQDYELDHVGCSAIAKI